MIIFQKIKSPELRVLKSMRLALSLFLFTFFLSSCEKDVTVEVPVSEEMIRKKMAELVAVAKQQVLTEG